MARRSRGRDVNGVVLLDKPGGISSNRALQQVRRLFDANKAGHTGALDPLATGMLPLCFGEATKFSQFVLDADKRYIATARLGIRTDSSDADGAVVEEKPVVGVTAERVRELLASEFSGEITQVPSIYSALKHNGQPLYKLARKGIEVEVKSRRVTIHRIELLDFRGDELDIEVFCSKGTYIRSIVEDLGLMLGCGAHVSMLRRLDSGPYREPQMLTLEQLQEIAAKGAKNGEKEGAFAALDKVLLPVWSAVDHFPRVALDANQAQRIQNGQAVADATEERGTVLLFDPTESNFYGLGEVSSDGVLTARRLMKTS
ncbi:tRNA pseudouridine(55) synthase TruB [Motiliproteus sediminis]|uniref:tRNA pseudouridine(55) synthase TruB n=1 Tax=Motiliproteus sediminis TaxID=1468178 RepID=UPI001AEFAF89|nr:tRNA pseudouridine(55) synthase TruB [Motiliproteus sediminis]